MYHEEQEGPYQEERRGTHRYNQTELLRALALDGRGARHLEGHNRARRARIPSPRHSGCDTDVAPAEREEAVVRAIRSTKLTSALTSLSERLG